MRKSRLKRIVNALIITSLLVVTSNFGYQVQAASVTTFSDNLSRLKTSTLADHTIKFVTPTGLAGAGNFTLTFDGDFTMGSFAIANFDLATGATCGSISSERTLGTGAASGATWQVVQAGSVVTFTSGTDTITAGHCVEVQIGANATSGGAGATQITNPGTAQAATVAVGGGFGDTGTAVVAIVDTNFDQVSVSATVDPTISFAIDDAAIGFGALTTANVRYATADSSGTTTPGAATNLTVATNATSGYTVYVQGSTLATGTGPTINAIGGTATASSPNSEQFGIKVGASGGSGAALAPYDTANYAYNATSVTQDDIASSIGPSATTTFAITYIANIAATTEAGSYSTTLTYTATGSF